jgi:hypothetical protein
VRKGWAAVILQRTKQRIGIDLIARASQITAAVIAAEVVSKRRDGAAVIEVFSPDAPAFRIILDISTTLSVGSIAWLGWFVIGSAVWCQALPDSDRTFYESHGKLILTVNLFNHHGNA